MWAQWASVDAGIWVSCCVSLAESVHREVDMVGHRRQWGAQSYCRPGHCFMDHQNHPHLGLGAVWESGNMRCLLCQTYLAITCNSDASAETVDNADTNQCLQGGSRVPWQNEPWTLNYLCSMQSTQAAWNPVWLIDGSSECCCRNVF